MNCIFLGSRKGEMNNGANVFHILFVILSPKDSSVKFEMRLVIELPHIFEIVQGNNLDKDKCKQDWTGEVQTCSIMFHCILIRAFSCQWKMKAPALNPPAIHWITVPLNRMKWKDTSSFVYLWFVASYFDIFICSSGVLTPVHYFTLRWLFH